MTVYLYVVAILYMLCVIAGVWLALVGDWRCWLTLLFPAMVTVWGLVVGHNLNPDDETRFFWYGLGLMGTLALASIIGLAVLARAMRSRDADREAFEDSLKALGRRK